MAGSSGFPVESGPGSAAAPSSGEVLGLLSRMRAGDREAAAEFITRFGSRVRRRIRGKLSQPMRRLFDSQELMSTLARRLDAFVRSGQLEAATEGQLWSLLFRMAENAVIDKARVFRRLQAVEGEDGPLAAGLLRELERASRAGPEECDLEIERTFRALPDAMDRAILALWLTGSPHTVTAECVGLSAAAVRQRWVSIRERLRASLAGEAC